MAVRGVRISWLMLARKALFEMAAASAASFASCSASFFSSSSAVRSRTRSSRSRFRRRTSSSAPRRWVMSRWVATQCVISPSPSL